MRSASHCPDVLPGPLALAHTQLYTFIQYTWTHHSPGGVEWMVHFEIHQERESLWGSYCLTSILKSLKRQNLSKTVHPSLRSDLFNEGLIINTLNALEVKCHLPTSQLPSLNISLFFFFLQKFQLSWHRSIVRELKHPVGLSPFSFVTFWKEISYLFYSYRLQRNWF